MQQPYSYAASPEHQEDVMAFLQKRMPVFTDVVLDEDTPCSEQPTVRYVRAAGELDLDLDFDFDLSEAALRAMRPPQKSPCQFPCTGFF